jgi:hypothetical protein
MDKNDKPLLTHDDELDLRARVTVAHYFAHVLLQGYNALRSHGVDFMRLREWKENSILEEAWKLKPTAAQSHIMGYLERLSHAITAAVKRKQNVRLVQDNSDIYTE